MASIPYPEARADALQKLKALFHSQDWTTVQKSEGVTLKTYSGSSSASVPIIRGDATYGPAECSLEDVFSVASFGELRKHWDSRTEGGQALKIFNSTAYVFQTLQYGFWPIVSGRDIVGMSDAAQEGDHHYLYQFSVPELNQQYPPAKDKVRANLAISGWILRPSSAVPGGLDITYIVDIDIGGSIPTAVVKQVSTQTPLLIARVVAYLKSHGAPPFLWPNNAKQPAAYAAIESQKIDQASGHYVVELSFGGTVESTADAIASLSIDTKVIYPHGVSLKWTAPPGDEIAIRSDVAEKRIHFVPKNAGALDPTKIYRLEVTKKSSGAVSFDM
ncbi:uncharacterized protein BJ171DRAFT_460303 [Polychytrium aggregatum]|uniref:uncharacterized protein n=1 Tax=Polychytrium aggregatum TaxID=110093 RepID=UPI0022FE044A|nr:uncharacterized protein BJ171DRAFT_460303 [Polychytrium aggregatum]KAI9203476.1 hypothetical protein BJ171DRAFT_460303 [Polychytrium aggregatum]